LFVPDCLSEISTRQSGTNNAQNCILALSQSILVQIQRYRAQTIGKFWDYKLQIGANSLAESLHCGWAKIYF
jgi:hypothetical protein